MKKLNFILIISSVLLFLSCATYKPTAEIKESDIHHHISYLASDELSGRYPGTDGDRLAADYIQKVFTQLKMKPTKQVFSFPLSVRIADDNSFEIDGESVYSGSFAPFGFSKDTLVNGGVVFAGYGISVKADSFEWDDYKNLDVKGKWVMALRGSPDDMENSQFFELGAEDRDKAILAEDQGAAGLILVCGSRYCKDDVLTGVSGRQARVNIPVFQITRAVADKLMESSGSGIDEIEASSARKQKFQNIRITSKVSARSHIENVNGTTSNVYAMIEGTDPVLKDEYIVFGAHADHLGMGGKGSSSRKPDSVAVHNGADDNASGIAAMLEIAARLKSGGNSLKRSVLFVAFGAEEMGLLGSKYFVNHFPVDISKVDAMVNLDMVGRLNERKGLQVGGTGTSAEADSLISLANKTLGLKITESREGSGPSDHSSFYGKNKPVFFLTTGAHTDYHTPDDDVNRLNMHGVAEISKFAVNLATAIDQMPGDLTFMEAGPKETASPSVRFKVTLGFMPDFSDTDVEGVRVDFVTKGKAAERGGIKNGDIITAIDGMPVRNIYDYMYRLSKLSKSQIISVELLREGKKEVLVMQL